MGSELITMFLFAIMIFFVIFYFIQFARGNK